MKKYKKHLPLPIVLLVAFVTGALGAVAGTLLVSAHGGDASKIHACVKNNSGTIRIVGANDTCNNNETALDWDKEAEAGTSPLVCIDCSIRDVLVRLNRSDFINANLDRAVLSNTHMQNQDFTGASFVETVWVSSGGEGTNFTNADFTRANLSASSFGDIGNGAANFTGANFTEADLTNAHLQGATMINATLINTIWSGTTCPDGTNSDNNGNTCEGHLNP